jgi:hypothetical protein
MRTATLATLLAALLLLAAGHPAAGKPQFTEQNDRLVLQNEHIAVSLQGKKPLLEVSEAGNASRGYQVFLQRLVELPAGASVGGSAEAASFNLARAEAWQVSHTDGPDGITITMHREGPIETHGKARGPGGLPLPDPVSNVTGNLTANATTGNASVTLVFHLYPQATQVQSGNATVNVTTYEVKFDLVVERWDWLSRADVLAFEFQVVERGNASTEGAVTNDTVPASQNGTQVGWVGWAAEAQAVYNGTAQNVSVDHVEPGQAGGDDAPKGAGPKHWLVYEAPGFDALSHDPSVGVVPSGDAGTSGTSAVPGFEPLALLAAAPAAVLLARRARRP